MPIKQRQREDGEIEQAGSEWESSPCLYRKNLNTVLPWDEVSGLAEHTSTSVKEVVEWKKKTLLPWLSWAQNSLYPAKDIQQVQKHHHILIHVEI